MGDSDRIAVGTMHGIGEAVVARHEHVLAAVVTRNPRLSLVRYRAEHDRAEAPRPGADEEADPAGRCMHDQARASADVAEVAQREVGGDAFQQQRGGGFVFPRCRRRTTQSAGTLRMLQYAPGTGPW